MIEIFDALGSRVPAAAVPGGLMEVVKKLSGVYLVGVAVAVAVYFIIGAFLPDDFDALSVWEILDILMVVGLGLALLFNYDRKRREGGRDAGEPVTRRYLEVNLLFYLTAGITILFLHNWFALLGLGADNLGGPDASGNHQRWVIWAVVDTVLPIVLGVTGCHMWSDSAKSDS